MGILVSQKLGLAGMAIAAVSGAALIYGNASAIELSEDTTLEADVTDGIVVQADSTVKLNLNGHSVTNSANKMAPIINYGNLEISGEGTISTSQDATAAVTNYPNAVMAIAGGTYTSDSWYIIRNYGEMTIAGSAQVLASENNKTNASMVTNGWVGSSDSNNNASLVANSGQSEPAMYINGGTFTAGLTNCSVIKNDDYSHLTITDGAFSQPKGSAPECDTVILNWNEAVIEGGVFYSENGPIVSNGAYTGNADKGLIEIAGGVYNTGANGTILGYAIGGNGVGRMTISGGEYSQGLVKAPENVYTIEVTGGTYGTEFDDESIVKEGYVLALNEETDKWQVVNPNNLPENREIETQVIDGEEVKVIVPIEIDWYNSDTPWFEELYNDNYAVTVDLNQSLTADHRATLAAVEKSDLSGFQLSGEGELYKAIDISLLDRDGVEIEVSNNNLIVYIDISDEEYAELKAYDSIVVVYFNEDGVETERLAAELKGEAGGYYIEFTTTHLSTYGVVGVNEETLVPATGTTATPDTGTITRESGSALVASILTAVAVGIIVSVLSFAVLIRRK